MNEIVIKNKEQLIKILEDIRARGCATSSYQAGYEVFKESLNTLITVLENSK